MTAVSADWAAEFRAFTAFHAVAALSGAALVAAACVFGARLQRSASEARFRHGYGWAMLSYKLFETLVDCLPGRFDVQHSFPLQLCDIAAFVGAGAMITRRRAAQSILYFWGLGLSTQAVLLPTLRAGYGSIDFWFFWISHTMVIGSAVYDLVVGGFRPRLLDLGLVCAISAFYAAAMFTVDVGFDLNYGFLGNTTKEMPQAITAIGPWPLRVLKLSGSIGCFFVLMWVPWAIAHRCRGGKAAGERLP